MNTETSNAGSVTAETRKLADMLATAIQEMPTRTKGVVSTTPTTTYAHGPGGLFSYPGISRPVFSAMSLPMLGLQSILPVQKSRDANPLYGILTGVTATTGSEPVGVCDDPPTAGLSKLCVQTQVFGRMARQTRVFELDRMGLWTNRGEFGDFSLVGGPQFGLGGNPNVPSTGSNDPNSVFKNEVGKAMFEFAVAWARDFATDVYQGNPTNNTAGGGRKYFNGLDILINTGHRDVISGQACKAADSIVVDFGGLDISTGTTTIVRRVTDVWRRLRYIAATTGLDPVRWGLVMRWNLFYELTALWPCAYETYRCSVTNTNDRRNVDTQYLNAMTENMRGDMYNRTGQYLLIDGERVPVILDDAVAETVLEGETFESDLYFVPLTVIGGTPVTFMEHLDYDLPGGAMEAAKFFAADGMYYTSDGGRFLWHRKLPANFCVQMLAKTEPRLMMLTPQIAARILNIRYTPIAHERDWDPASSFFVNGGKTDYDGWTPSFYTPVS